MKLDGVERNVDSVKVNVYSVLGRGRVMPKLGMRICARTIARIRQHADKDHSG